MPYLTYPVRRHDEIGDLGWYPGQKKKKKLKEHKDRSHAGMMAAKKKYDEAVAKAESLEEDAKMIAQEAEEISQMLLARGVSITKQKEIMAGLVKIPGAAKIVAVAHTPK